VTRPALLQPRTHVMGLDREAVMAEATGAVGCFASGSSGPRFHSTTAGISSATTTVDASGQRVDGFEDSDVDAVTSLVDVNRQTVDLRVDLKGRRALIFEVSGDDEIAKVGKRLGIDIERARSRYQAGSLAAKPLAVFFFAGLCCLLYSLFGKPEPETAVWLARINLFAFLPITVLMSIPTTIDVGRDGVAWRWLFMRRYRAFASMVSMVPSPKAATGTKVNAMLLGARDGMDVTLPLGAKSAGAADHLLAAFAASNRAVEATPVDEWLSRGAAESALLWIQRVRARSVAGGTYRGSDLLHLWVPAEDLATPHDLRCAMLIALATTDVARERTRALAAQVVDPDVQALFQAIADGASDDQLALLLGRVSNTAPA